MSTKQFKRVLVANRGEIAVRVARTVREMGMSPLAVYSDADRNALHVRRSDMAYYIGESPAPESYLRVDKILEAAKAMKADAVHPGYGFLSENTDFAAKCTAAGIEFIGPPSKAIEVMGSKTAARDTMKAAKVPSVPGTEGAVVSEEEAIKEAEGMGYPVMLKAAAGGGGKGMRLVHNNEEMKKAFRSARSEAKNAFGDDTVYIEKAIIEPRHVEIQIMSGPDGRTVWLGERECSMQRRHQKVIEETPSPAIGDDTRRKMGEVACRAAEAVGYVGAGTVEFLVDRDENFYFLEMNTRLQVEHPVTELCCGLDLVETQIRVAQGEPLPYAQEDIRRTGHAMEARVYAENPHKNFLPSPGHIVSLNYPQGPGIRVDAGVDAGFEVPRYYDPMIAKICSWGQDREQARRRLHRALSETMINGITTNTRFLQELLETEQFRSGNYHTGSIAEIMEREREPVPDDVVEAAIVAGVVNRFRRDKFQARLNTGGGMNSNSPSTPGWRAVSWRWRNG